MKQMLIAMLCVAALAMVGCGEEEPATTYWSKVVPFVGHDSLPLSIQLSGRFKVSKDTGADYYTREIHETLTITNRGNAAVSIRIPKQICQYSAPDGSSGSLGKPPHSYVIDTQSLAPGETLQLSAHYFNMGKAKKPTETGLLFIMEIDNVYRIVSVLGEYEQVEQFVEQEQDTKSNAKG